MKTPCLLRAPSIPRHLRRAALSLLFAPWLQAADLPLARLETLSLPVFAAGQEAETVLSGSDLEGVESLWFSEPGISARWVKDRTFVVRVEPGVAEGAYDVRAVGTHGVSNPRGIFVDRIPALKKSEGCSPLKPMEVTVGAVVAGTMPAASKDAFRFAAQAGQRITVRCVAREIDSRLVPMLSVVDDTGRRVAAASRSEELHFVAQRTGPHTVVLNDLTFAGGADYPYRLSVDESAWLAGAIPSVLEPGQKNRVLLLGKGLPHGRPASNWLGAVADGWQGEEMEIDVPPLDAFPRGRDGVLKPGAAGANLFPFRLRGAAGTSNALHFLAGAGKPASLHPNSSVPKEGSPALIAMETLPASISGVLTGGLRGIGIQWQARAGEVLWAEVFSQRLGFDSCSPFLRLDHQDNHRAEAYGPETNAGGPKLGTLHNDPLLRFEIKEAGLCQLRVSDLTQSARAGLGNSCAVVLNREPPRFSLVAATEPPPESTNDRSVAPRGTALRTGGTAALRVIALRAPGFNEPIQLEAQGLPAGVQSEKTWIPAGKNDGFLILSANGPLPKEAVQIRVVGRSAATPFESVARGAVCKFPVNDSNLDAAPVRLTRGMGVVIGTTPFQAPLAIQLGSPATVQVPVGGKMEVALKLVRKPEFQVPLKIKAGGFSGSETSKEIDVSAVDTTVKIPLDLAALKLGAGHHAVFFTAQGKAKLAGTDVTPPIYSPPVQIHVVAPDPASPPASAPQAAGATPAKTP